MGVCKFWKCLSIHNKLDTVDLFFSPSPSPYFYKLPSLFPSGVFSVAQVIIFHFLHYLEKSGKTSECLLTRN